MPEIGLTDFVDFCLKAGPTQLTKVRELKTRPDYDPATDYWKRLRDGLTAFVCGVIDMKQLEEQVAEASRGKQRNYAHALVGFKKFDARKPDGVPGVGPSGRWSEGELIVRVTPEIAFCRDNQRTCIKLYFKGEPRPTKDRLGAILVLMQETFPKDRVGVLDVRSARLYDELPRRSSMDVFLRAQAHALIHMWNGI